jgi:hypothetical protein
VAGTFPPDYFSTDYFGPDYFGGETNPNALSAAIGGTSSVTADLTALSSDLQASIVCSSSMTGTISVRPTVPVDDEEPSGVRRLAESEKVAKPVKKKKPALVQAPTPEPRETYADAIVRKRRERDEQALVAKAEQDRRNQKAIQMLLAMIDVIDDERDDSQEMQAVVLLADILDEVA